MSGDMGANSVVGQVTGLAEFQDLDSETTVTIQPGLAVSVYGSRLQQLNASFPSDDQYIHLNYLLKGQFKAQVRGTKVHLNQGESVMGFSCGEPFEVLNSPPYRNLDIRITPQLLSNLIESESTHDNFLGIDLARIGFFIKPACSTSKLSTTANHIAALIDKPDSKLLLYSAVLEFIHWQLEAFKTQAINENLSLRERFQLELARDYLLKDLSQPPTIANIAAVVGLHPGKLKKGFKQMYGDTIYAHFQKARMKKATTLLKDNNVTETAMILGYSNVSHFSAAFFKELNIKPKEFRRQTLPTMSG